MQIHLFHPSLRVGLFRQRAVLKPGTYFRNEFHISLDLARGELRAHERGQGLPLFPVVELNVLVHEWGPEAVLPFPKVIRICEHDAVNHVRVVDVQDRESTFVDLEKWEL